MHKNLRAEEPPAVLEQLPDLIHSCLSWSSWKLLGMPPAGQSDPAGQPLVPAPPQLLRLTPAWTLARAPSGIAALTSLRHACPGPWTQAGTQPSGTYLPCSCTHGAGASTAPAGPPAWLAWQPAQPQVLPRAAPTARLCRHPWWLPLQACAAQPLTCVPPPAAAVPCAARQLSPGALPPIHALLVRALRCLARTQCLAAE
mmetsp:Transcript_15995/g.43589  ORF Transcript_15995/g.43589 Transcript_15995/m.43589 type:complete len:200 (+) Transcript_15995:527-1126(+)